MFTMLIIIIIFLSEIVQTTTDYLELTFIIDIFLLS